MKKLSIVYDVTALCPWNCAICCMGASNDETCRSRELSQAQKLDVIRQIKELTKNGYDIKIDLSGGEPFSDPDRFMELLTEASAALGKEKIGVSCSGYAITQKRAEFLAQNVRDVEMTMDVVPHKPYKLRPVGYGEAAAKAVSFLKKAGCEVGLQTVVSAYNNEYADALGVFAWACANGVDNWSILRFFPSGRGAAYPDAALNDSECESYVHMVQEMVNSIPCMSKPKVDFHYLMPGHKKHSTICRCVRHSIGILPNGDVVACFWALDSSTGTIDPKFLLGNVKEHPLLEILNNEKTLYWSNCEHSCELSCKGDSQLERSCFKNVLSA